MTRDEEVKAFLAKERAAFFETLRAAGVAEVEAEFSGSGDSGQFDTIVAYGQPINGNPNELDTDVKIDDKQTLADLIDEFCSSILWADYSGWENNDGASGTFEIDVEKETIVLGIDQYYTSSDREDREY